MTHEERAIRRKKRILEHVERIGYIHKTQDLSTLRDCEIELLVRGENR